MSDDGASGVYRLKVSLPRISPMIWRRLLVSEEMTLFGVHRTIQIAFGWEDYHLHAFRLHGRHYGTTRIRRAPP
ncbi:plasmid pRiA4b ORF-3 family protein [Mesorhizobium sp. ArgA1]